MRLEGFRDSWRPSCSVPTTPVSAVESPLRHRPERTGICLTGPSLDLPVNSPSRLSHYCERRSCASGAYRLLHPGSLHVDKAFDQSLSLTFLRTRSSLAEPCAYLPTDVPMRPWSIGFLVFCSGGRFFVTSENAASAPLGHI